MNFFDLRAIPKLWNSFFHERTETWSSGVLRIGLGIILLINVTVFSADALLWYSNSGALSYQESRLVVHPDTTTLFSWFDNTPGKVAAYFCLLFLTVILFTVGLYARVQAVIIFLLLASLHHRNPLMMEGEDVMMRLLSFYCIFLPLDHNFSVRSWWRKRRQQQPFTQETPIWPLRLIQFQITLLWVSTSGMKLHGPDWIDGTAMYYVSRLDDVFVGGLFPDPLLNSLAFLRFLTWGVLAFETLLPLGLWIKQTRKWFLYAAVLFHLAIDFNMNLFLFHWIMIVALVAFLQRDDLPPKIRQFLPAGSSENGNSAS